MNPLLRIALRVVRRAAGVLLKAPLALSRQLYRFVLRLSGALTLIAVHELPCSGCGQAVSLVGRFQCGRCNCVFDGYAFRACPVCRSIPPYIPCTQCGVSLRNPMR
jgi:hypothetical protein